MVSNKNLGFIRGGWGEVTAHLNGHTLRTEFIRNTGNSFYMCHTTFEGEGKIEVGSGWLQTTNYSNYACIGRNLTVEFPNVDGGGLWLQAPFTVSNYLSRVGYNTGNATLTVLGAFTPVDNGTNQFPNIFMPGGSTLDLSRMDTPFSVIDQNGHKVELENGAAYSVYVGLRGIAVGDKLVSWESMPDASTDFRLVCDGEPAETRGLAAVARSDGLYVKSAATPAYAMWDLEAGQWRFFTADGVAYQDEWADGITRDIEVRFSSYEEYSAVKAQAVRPSAFRLTGLTLPEGSDFYDMDPGFKLDFNAGLVIDVKGNSLKLPVSTVSDDKASTVTSSVDGGELIVDVPVGATVANTAMSLTGSLSLVKRGEGTFVSKKAQTYTGGTFVEAGKAQPPNGSAASTTYSWDNFKAFGTGEITVAENAAFDLRSNYAYRDYIHLDGGTLMNGGPDNMTKTGWGGSGIGSLTKDSTLNVNYSIVFGDSGLETDLGGHTLTVNIASGRSLYLRTSVINDGKIDITSGGWFQPVVAVNATNVDIRVGSALNLAAELSVRDYEQVYGANYNNGSAALNVYGVFTPAVGHDYFYGCTMRDGSTIDLSGKEGNWSTTSAFTSGARTVLFADGASVTVNLAGREDLLALAKSENPYVVEWAEEPDNVIFKLDEHTYSRGLRVQKESSGLRLFYIGGTTILLR